MSRPTILVVDDDSSGRAMLSLSLRQAGFPVEMAANGEEALRLLDKKHYDWLITDARMLPMDGFALIRKAKRLQPNLHVIMISAICTEADTGNYPIEKFFSKPVPVEALVGWLSRDAGPGVAASSPQA